MQDQINLSTHIGRLSFSNPTILASGIMDEDAESIKRILHAGAGGIVTKSIGINSNKGHANPTFVELDYGILNAMGLPNPGIDEFKNELAKLKTITQPIIGSVYGKNENEFAKVALIMEQSGIKAIELNLSCPHASGYGLELGQDPEMVHSITQYVKKKVKIPVFVKLSSNVNNITLLAEAAANAHADAIVAINTVKAMAINTEIQRPVLSHKTGGYSGKAIKPIGLRAVYDLHSQIEIPIIGVGGITTGIDVIEYFMAGAQAVEIGSAIYYRGITVFKDICEEITQWLQTHNYNNIRDIIGVAH